MPHMSAPVIGKLVTMADFEFISFERLIEFGLHTVPKHQHSSYRSGIRPNHWVRENQYTVIGQIDFIDCDRLAAGQSCKAICSFYAPKEDEKLFTPGFKWDIGEATKIIGYGKVVSE